MTLFSKQLAYVKEFDSIRAIAVLLVILAHWFPGGITSSFSFGPIGVDIFFTLSGFLISRILIVERVKYETSNNKTSRLNSIKNFMIRRSLRIIPIYYLLLFLLIFFNDVFSNPVKQDWKWYFFYLQNILFHLNNAWPGGKLSHLWSLAVEEQFYLFWPWLILFFPLKWLLEAIITCFFIGFISVNFLFFSDTSFNSDILTSSCIHAFAAGGIIAYFQIQKENQFYRNKNIFIITGLISFFYLLVVIFKIFPPLIDIRTIISIVMIGLLTAIIFNKKRFYFLLFLENKILISIGKISYGVYLFHNFIPTLLNAFLHWLEKKSIFLKFIIYKSNLCNQNILFYIFSFLILISICYISFYFFERPINKLKFKYV
jgi:peptidoglycan/LPS O-acetylase OafA/YrhL